MVPSSNGICSDITDNELMNILKTTSQYSDWPDSLKILHKKNIQISDMVENSIEIQRKHKLFRSLLLILKSH